MKGKIEGSDGKRVCVLHYRPNRIIEDLLPALREIGMEVLELDVQRCSIQTNGEYGSVFSIDGRIDYVPYVYRKLEEFNPDLILTSNSQGIDPSGLLYVIAELKEIPLVNWFLDSPYFAAPIRRPKDLRYVYYAVFDPVYAEQMRAENYPNVFAFSLGANPARFADAVQADNSAQQGLLFVGKSGLPSISRIFSDIEMGIGGIPEPIKRKIQGFIERSAIRLMQSPDKTPDVFIDEHAARHPDERKFYKHPDIGPLVANIIDFKASFYRRREVINSITYADVTVAGDEAWCPHLRPETRFLGLVPYERVGLLYRNTAINVNVSRYQLKRSANQRVFDVPAAEGFLLTDYRPGLEKIFEKDKEVVFYETTQDLEEKARYYMAHPEMRVRIARRARERVLQDHTYTNRARELVTLLVKSGAKKGAVKKGNITQRALTNKFNPQLEKLIQLFQADSMDYEANLFGRKKNEPIQT